MTMSERSALGSMGDEFIEARFDPKYRDLFQGKIEEFEREKDTKTNPIPIHFHGTIMEKASRAIKLLVEQILLFADRCGLVLASSSPEIHFYSISAWEGQEKRKLTSSIPLPASKIVTNQQTVQVQVILPEAIDSNEAVINTVRTLFSKLYGQLFFREHVPLRPPFKVNQVVDEDQFDLAEKARFCRVLDTFPNRIQQQFKVIGKENQVPEKIAEKQGQSIFFKALIEDAPGSPEGRYLKLLDELFSCHLKDFKDDGEKKLTRMEEKLFALLPQTNFILPHELNNFRLLRSQSKRVLFHALEERLQLVVNMLGEINECKVLYDSSARGEMDASLAMLWRQTFRERMKSLKQRGWVKLFLIPGARLSEKQKREKAQFPLWIWKHVLAGYPDPPQNPEQEVKRIEGQFQNAVFQKVFETCERVIQALDKSTLEGISLEEADTSNRLKSLFAWIKFRIDTLEDMLCVVRIGKTLALKSEVNHEELTSQLETFEKGWSYYISFAMIHLFYMEMEKKRQQKDQRALKFYQLIQQYLDDKIQSDPSYQMAELFRLVYEQSDFDLGRMIHLVTYESPPLDFFVQNRERLTRSKPAGEIKPFINHFAEMVQYWLEERDHTRIDKNYIDSLKEKGFSPADYPEQAKGFI